MKPETLNAYNEKSQYKINLILAEDEQAPETTTLDMISNKE